MAAADSEPQRYPPQARWLHAVVAVLAIAMLLLGSAMTRLDLEIGQLIAAYQVHKSVGAILWLLMLWRLAVRWRNPPPLLPSNVTRTNHRLAASTQRLLYMILLILPISGWLIVSASPLPIPISLFGLVDVPSLSALATLPEGPRIIWYARLKFFHTALAWLLLVASLMHIAAALIHGRNFRRRMSLRWRPNRRTSGKSGNV